MRSFEEIYQTACLHKGGVNALEACLPRAASAHALQSHSDNEYLSAMCRRVFRAGLKHSMVDGKWPAFEKRFAGFDPMFCAMLSDEALENAMADRSIIRHLGKLRAIQANAQFVMEVAREHGSFGHYLAEWKPEQTVDLWWELKKRGKHLGGNSGPAFLRMVGKDTFLLTRDVVAVLKTEAVVDRQPSSRRDMLAAQDAFISWQEESGRPLCEISRIVSCTATH